MSTKSTRTLPRAERVAPELKSSEPGKTNDYVMVVGKKPAITAQPLQARRKGRRGAKRMGRSFADANLNPTIRAAMEYTYRGYYLTASGTGTCTRQSIANAMGFIALTSTTGVAIHTCFRIKRVTLWPVTNDTTPPPELKWVSNTAEGALNKDDTKIRPRISGITTPEKIVYVPPRDTFAHMWQNCSQDPTDPIFSIRTGGNCVVLFEAQVVQAYGNTACPPTGSFTGGVAGNYYRYSLDYTTSGNILESLVASIF